MVKTITKSLKPAPKKFDSYKPAELVTDVASESSESEITVIGFTLVLNANTE